MRFFKLFLVLLILEIISQHAHAQTQGQSALAQPANAENSNRLMADPNAITGNPFMPKAQHKYELPVAADGFCLVTLRDSQQWVDGLPETQVVFDGQIYWFASNKQRAIFLADPSRYLPAFAGDCVVSFLDSEKRIAGSSEFGLIHDGRVFFFRSAQEQQEFEANPKKYAKVDLANNGNCLVAQVEQGRTMPGIPETLVVVDGMRYFFQGAFEQKKFLVDMAKYGVAMPELPKAEKQPSRRPLARAKGPQSSAEESAKPLKAMPETSMAPLAMQGYCPVSIQTVGLWRSGLQKFRSVYDGKMYLFATQKEKDQFLEDPYAYIPALGGDCVVTKIDSNLRVQGSVFHAKKVERYKNRLYLFAGSKEVEAFTANPDRYIDADLAEDGNCIVTQKEDGELLAGLPELMAWHKGMRYYFASPEKRERFKADSKSYLEPNASTTSSDPFEEKAEGAKQLTGDASEIAE